MSAPPRTPEPTSGTDDTDDTDQADDTDQTGEQEREGRTGPEWVAFGVSCAVIAVVVALIVLQMFETQQPAAPVAQVEAIQQIGASHHVRIAVTNEGTTTAANVQVSAELEIDGAVVGEGDQSIDFLAGDETEELVFVFEDDPADGELTISVAGYSVP
jgi:uncharacterized protein (TIGR02588 family)